MEQKFKIEEHIIKQIKIAEIASDDIIINNAEDGLNLLGNLYYQGFDEIVLKSKNITPDFFDLKNGKAGEILQKFSNYRMGLTIIGDFSLYTAKSIKDFIYESNKSGNINFVFSIKEALEKISRK